MLHLAYDFEDSGAAADGAPLRAPAADGACETANFSSQHSDPTEARRKLGFLTAEELRARVADTMLSGVYAALKPKPELRREAIATQTDGPSLTSTAVGDGDSALGPPARTVDLDLQLPAPHDFPVLTLTQLLDTERRLHELLTHLEAELLRVEDAKEAAQRAADAAAVWDKAGRRGGLVSSATWFRHMSETVDRRMRARHGDATGELLPSQWARQKAEQAASPIRESRNSIAMLHSPGYSAHILEGSPVARSQRLVRQNFASDVGVDDRDILAEVEARRERRRKETPLSRGMQIALGVGFGPPRPDSQPARQSPLLPRKASSSPTGRR